MHRRNIWWRKHVTDLLRAHDQVMTDKRFLIDDICCLQNASFVIPSFLGEKGISRQQRWKTHEIARHILTGREHTFNLSKHSSIYLMISSTDIKVVTSAYLAWTLFTSCLICDYVVDLWYIYPLLLASLASKCFCWWCLNNGMFYFENKAATCYSWLSVAVEETSTILCR